MRFGNDINNAIFIFLDKNASIKVDVDLKNPTKYQAKGNQETVDMMELIQTSNKNFIKIDTAYAKLKNSNAKQADSLSVLF